MSNEPPRAERGFRELGEDTTGFGVVEARTAWHSLTRPAQLLEAYMTGGPTGHGDYARPLRLYLAICGFLMLVLFLMGGTRLMLADMPAATLQPLLDQAGKTEEAFLNDADGWASLVLVPITALFYALFTAPLLRWWDPDDIGWRKAFRATFFYLNAWTIPLLPFAWLAYIRDYAPLSMALMAILSVAAFVRGGRGRWYRSLPGGFAKGVVLTAVSMLASLAATVPIIAIGIVGGLVSG